MRTLAGLAGRVGDALGLEAAGQPAEAFLRGLAGAGEADAGLADRYAVCLAGEGACEIEVELRAPGEPKMALYRRSVRAMQGALAAFGSLSGWEDVLRWAVDLLLPGGNAIPRLPWPSMLRAALSADGNRPAIRLDVGLDWGEPGHRLRRVLATLPIIGGEALADAVEALDAAARGSATLVAASLRVTPDRIRLDRLDYALRGAAADVAGLLPQGRLDGACRRLGRAAAAGGLDGAPPCLSFRLDDTTVTAVSVGLVVAAGGGIPDGPASRLLARLEEDPGQAQACRRARQAMAEAPDMRLLGASLTLAPAMPVESVAVCLSLPGPAAAEPAGPRLAGPAEMRRAALAFVAGEQLPGGAFPMEPIGKETKTRPCPPGWPDIYVTALAAQELHRQAPAGAERVRAGLDRFLAAQALPCRYLPSMPPDADDMAMVLACQLMQGRSAPDPIIAALLGRAAPDGGFTTYFGAEPIDANPGVTLNVVLALGLAGRRWDAAGTRKFLRAWLASPRFPEFPPMHAAALALYLLSRTTDALAWLGAEGRAAVARAVAERRRPEGGWGWASTEGFETALVVLACRNLALAVPAPGACRAVIRDLQHRDGGWGWGPLYSDGAAGTWYGSRALATVIALAALHHLGDG